MNRRTDPAATDAIQRAATAARAAELAHAALTDPAALAALVELAQTVLDDAAQRIELAAAVAGHDWAAAAPVTPAQDAAERARTAQARTSAHDSTETRRTIGWAQATAADGATTNYAVHAVEGEFLRVTRADADAGAYALLHARPFAIRRSEFTRVVLRPDHGAH
ncbi:hypothetical protein ACFYN0_34835 [Streptomyces sp. NPDC006704]|uniref:hypothetical protein n=1 Tax=Streptomyces sp. NPDC006704 TaxID=3364760 RepID=UPI00368593F2